MPATITNFCSPNDLYDYLSIEGVDLRLDDGNYATGQTITTTAAAIAGATTVYVSALEYPLLNGTQLTFAYAGQEDVITVGLTAAAIQGATSLTVSALSGAIVSGAQAQDSGVNLAMAARMTTAIKYATARVMLFCCNRYDTTQLVQSWSVQHWTVNIAANWLAKRRAQPVPQGIASDYEETMADLMMVKDGDLDIESIAPRTSNWPAFSNVTVDPVYTNRKVRVEPSISEPTATQYPQAIDWASYWLFEN